MDAFDLQKTLAGIPRPAQHQGSLTEQLQELRTLARHFGLYDADDFLEEVNPPGEVVERETTDQPSTGLLSYNHMGSTGFIFLETKKGPRMFAEIRGFGAGLPQDANAEKICRLWNDDYYRSSPCAACGTEYDNHSRQMKHCPGQYRYVFTTEEEARG